MSNPKCESCAYYHPFPFVRNEGECNDSTKIIYVQDVAQNNRPEVFSFSWCDNHEAKSDK